jgi:hypothetical protein
MSASSRTIFNLPRIKLRSVVFALLGAAALVLKRHYSGPGEELVLDYGGNVAASFAVYFIVTLLFLAARFRILLTTGLALLVVELFEATDGFGVMGNVYDSADFAANAAGVGLALAADVLTWGITDARHHIGAT